MENERLRDAMLAARVDIETITRETNVDPKTVRRWLKGRIPHPRHRWKIAELLKEHEDFLWPKQDSNITNHARTSEVVAVYAHRSDLPAAVWWNLFVQSQKQIDLLGYAMQFLFEQHSHLEDLLKEKAENGCKIRIALADPACQAVRIRDEEEQLEGTLPALIQTTLFHLRDLHSCNGIEIGYHAISMYNSIFRFDNEMLVTPHLYGQHGAKAPLLYLRCLEQNGIFTTFAKHFETVWATTSPIT
jgi:transcriptional regulator with XRE-family HTH domain